MSKEINRINKALHRRKQGDRRYRDLSLRIFELDNSKTELKYKKDASKQIISHVEEAKELVKLKIKELKRKNKKCGSKIPFEYTQYHEKQKEDNEKDLGFFLESTEESKIIYNPTPVNLLMEEMEELINGFLPNGYFSLGDE